MWYLCSAWRSTPNEGAEVRVVWMTGPNVFISFIKRERAVIRFLSSPQICLQASSKESAVMRFLSSPPYNMNSSYATYYKHNKKIVCPWGHQPILSWNSKQKSKLLFRKKKVLSTEEVSMMTSARTTGNTWEFCIYSHVHSHKILKISWDQVPILVAGKQTIQQGDEHAADLQCQKLCSLHQYTEHIH